MRFAEILIPVIVCIAISACGSGSDASSSSSAKYVVNISSDTDETGVQLLRITEPPEGNQIVEVIDTRYLGYGVGMFFSDQGSVPDSQQNIPQDCRNTATLGLNSAMRCWGEPTLTLVNSMLLTSGLSKSDVVVIADVSSSLIPYMPTEAETFEQPPTMADDFFVSFDDLAESKGFDSSIVVDE